MENKLNWQFSDFIVEPWTFGCMVMYGFVPNKRRFSSFILETGNMVHQELLRGYKKVAPKSPTGIDWFWRYNDGEFEVDSPWRGGRPDLWRCWVGGVAPSESVPNAKWAWLCIRRYPPRPLQVGVAVVNDSKTRNWGSFWFEAKTINVLNLPMRQEKKGFSSMYRQGWWKMDSLHHFKEGVIMGFEQVCSYVVVSAEYSSCKGFFVV